MNRSLLTVLVALSIAVALRPAPAAAQMVPEPKKVFQDVGIIQHLNAEVPADLEFRNEQGEKVRLGDYYGDKPIVLCLVYYQCPMLCGQVLNGVLAAAQAMQLELGNDYHIVTVSIDPTEGPELARAKKKTYVDKYVRDGGDRGWHFLTGPEASSKRLAEIVGFQFKWDDTTAQYAHASGIMVLTPQGKLSKYLYGIEYDPRDLRLALVDSGAGKIGTLVDQVLLLCFHYDPRTGKYGLAIDFLLKTTGSVTVLMLGAFVFTSLRSERRKQARDEPSPVPPAAG